MNQERYIRFLLLLALLIATSWMSPWIRHYDRNHGSLNEHVYGLRQDRTGMIWITTYGGLYSYDGQRFVLHKDSTVRRPTPGYRWKPATSFERMANEIASKEGIIINAEDRILCSLTDRDGNLWIGSSNGLWQLREQEYPFHFVNYGEEVLCLYRSREGELWMTTREGSVCILDNNFRPMAYLTETGAWSTSKVHCDMTVMNIMEDRDGVMWLSARRKGLIRMQRRATNTLNGFSISQLRADGKGSNGEHALDNVYATCPDQQGRIWTASLDTGLGFVQDTSPVSSDNIQNISTMSKAIGKSPLSNRFRCFLPLYSDEWLVGSDDGLYYLKPSSWQRGRVGVCKLITPNDSGEKGPYSVQCLQSDRRGYLYAGTSGDGLLVSTHLSDIRRFSNYRTLSKEADNMPSNVVYALTEDKNNNIWGFCDNTLFRVEYDTNGSSPKQYNARIVTIANYSGEETASWPAMSIGNSLQLPDGRMVKGTRTGLMWFYADSIMSNTSRHPIYLEAQYTYNDKDTAQTIADTLSLPRGVNSLKLYCSVLDYNREAQVLYAYRIADRDTTWKYTANPLIEFQNLPSGYSKIEVRATNGDGIWSGSRRTLTVHVKSGGHTTAAIIIILALIVSGTMFFMGRKAPKTKEVAETASALKPILDNIPTKDVVEEAFRNKVLKLIKDHIGDSEYNPEQLAKDMCMSKSALLSKVKRIFDTVPVELISRVRIQAATELLTQTELTISEVACRTGFNDPKYFSRVYKKFMGMSPSEARNNKAKK